MRHEIDFSHPSSTLTAAQRPARLTRIGEPACLAAMVTIWLACLVVGWAGGRQKLVVISLLAFAAMTGGWFIARRVAAVTRVASWADGLSAGAMLTSAALFLLPMAVGPSPTLGSAGVAAGFVLGVTLDRLLGIEHAGGTARDASVVAISIHALAAGIVMGLIYARMPALGLMLGVAIMSHKLPAGYALARNRMRQGRSTAPILWPAALVGLAAIPVALLCPAGTPAGNAPLFGIATGVFMHVGQDFSRVRQTPELAADRAFVIAMILGALAVVGLRELAVL